MLLDHLWYQLKNLDNNSSTARDVEWPITLYLNDNNIAEYGITATISLYLSNFISFANGYTLWSTN